MSTYVYIDASINACVIMEVIYSVLSQANMNVGIIYPTHNFSCMYLRGSNVVGIVAFVPELVISNRNPACKINKVAHGW